MKFRYLDYAARHTIPGYPQLDTSNQMNLLVYLISSLSGSGKNHRSSEMLYIDLRLFIDIHII
jgi:hypothetical protein